MRTPRLSALSVSVFAAGLVLGGTAGTGTADAPPPPAPVAAPVDGPAGDRPLSTHVLPPAGSGPGLGLAVSAG